MTGGFVYNLGNIQVISTVFNIYNWDFILSFNIL